jgi:hypothetical protein
MFWIISTLHAVHTSSGYLDLFYAHCTDQNTVRSVAWNKLCQEGSLNDLIRIVSKKSCNYIDIQND